ncbi:MAG: hypothetical protein ACKO0Z_12495 [Betaproteobacteria bacterium]
MGTKNKPGQFDCYANAEPDEPMFILLGRDPLAPLLVELWADVRSVLVKDVEKVTEARMCASAMREWPITKKLSSKVAVQEPEYWEIVNTIVQAYLSEQSEEISGGGK